MNTSVLDQPLAPLAVFDRDDELRDANHEQVVFCRDERTGLKAIIAIHDTTLGPGLGGTRFYPYANESLALTDALRLSEGMTYKAAGAGVPLGGAKAVIIGDPATQRTEGLLESYGKFVESLGGRYYTAADVGTTSEDLDIIGRTSTHVVGRTTAAGGSGDSGYATALGVFSAMQAAATATWGENGLADKVVGVEGVGKVGRHLVNLLQSVGARIVVSDPRADALTEFVGRDPVVRVADSVLTEELDVYAPCALGASLTVTSVAQLRAKVVCGAANNQLADGSVAQALTDRSILWVPDYLANAGGLIQVGGELTNEDRDDVLARVRRIEHTVGEVLRSAIDTHLTTSQAARRIVDERLAAGREG
ncbi:Glu/Leu/Phe/Val dehydrogenase dimerization domain-containing protein [Gordonia terrae]|uniref:Glu/Leu/Phe/Val dehydrogenase dimerization domain-containing protein n=1 Tax=Gordonia terrae TaxID=2055 RepID=UPI003F6D421E